MDVGIWRTSYSYPVSLVREVPGRWNDGYQSLCLLMTTTGLSQQTQSDFRMVGYDRFFCFMQRTSFVFDLVWEWRGDCAWRGCLVTRICTYT